MLGNKWVTPKDLASSLTSFESEHLFSVVNMQYTDYSNNQGAVSEEKWLFLCNNYEALKFNC